MKAQVDRRAILLSATVSLVCFGARAESAPTASDAASVVKALQDRLLDVIVRARSLTRRSRFAAIAPAIAETFDLAGMTRLAFGPKWDELTPQQQAEMLSAFGDFVAATYAMRFDDLEATGFDMTPASEQRDSETIVKTHMRMKSGAPLALDYVMTQTAAGWRIRDVLANGSISELAHWRTLLRAYGADGADAASAALRKQTAILLGQ